MQKIWLLGKAFLKREFILFKRYFFNSLGGIITLYVIFLMLFLGFKGVGGPNVGESIEGLVVGYTLWMFALSAYQDITLTIQREAREGTLEQLYMSVYNFGWVMAAKTFAQSLINLIIVVGMLFLLMFTTGTFLNLDVVSLVPLVFFTLPNFFGLGFIFGGIALIFKQINNYLQIMQFVLILFVSVPVGSVPIFKFMPGSWGSSLIYRVMLAGESIFQFAASDLVFLCGIGLAYLLLGIAVYKICERIAIDRGLLGQY